ncbi:MAG: histidine kinase, partial [Candidatus Eisenbacteria bacterium]|nr:histidine kinase [Candidatus Latescibacterota bacterium]MBD3303198.1 histidine kinase [Candidatus Eisenbacteria bacterium]
MSPEERTLPAEEDRFAGMQEMANRVFADLMAYRIRDVLLVSSPYDSFTLEEDGLLSESLDVEYHQLNLSAAPRITQVPTGEEALRALENHRFDLVISMARLGEMGARGFGSAVKSLFPDLPVVFLAYTPMEAASFKQAGRSLGVDQVFIWRGDVRIFLAIIKYIEDVRNVERDIELAGVRAIVLIENSVRFYSSYLPLLYTELMKQSQSLMADGVNVSERLRRMKARPKVLLAEDFESGWSLFERYHRYILGIISDARFSRGGSSDPEAGIEFVRRVRERDADMPALIQSSDDEVAARAAEIGAGFLNKRSPRLLEELRRFIQSSLGFGDFVFMLPDGKEVMRVGDLAQMPHALRKIPEESLRYHASRNHFSNWSLARTEFALAERIRPIKVSEFETTEELRRYLIEAFNRVRSDTQQGLVADFSRLEFGETSGFARIGGGSMGGKGRGLGFIHAYLPRSGFDQRFEETQIFIPPSAVIGTDVFEEFLERNRLSDLAFSDAPDEKITRDFTRAKLPKGVVEDLRVFLQRIDYPIAVRSSSLLEDSHDRPFAGIYETYMLTNRDPDPKTRLRELCTAVKLVYASTFYQNAKSYLQNTQHRMEEERMAVILQKLVGHDHGGYFYPDVAGVARSYNHYPVLGMNAEDGIALVALGFGKTVVDGERCVRFSPGSPRSLPQFSTTEEILENAQRKFYALDLSRSGVRSLDGRDGSLVSLDLDAAERHGTLSPVGSVYSPDNDAVYDGISRQGPRLVTFA